MIFNINGDIMSFDINIAVMAIFLLITIFVGLSAGVGVKNIKDYALGGRSFNTATLTATIVATWMSGSFFSIAITETYEGALGFILGVAYVLNLLIVSYFFAPRVKQFFGKLSVADVMGDLYGKTVRVITGISSIILTISLLALQIKVFSTIFSQFLIIDSFYATILCTLIVIFYSAFGGIRSVTFTDVIQLITFGVLIPVLALVIWETFGSFELIVNVFETNPAFDHNKLLDYKNYDFWIMLVLFLYYLIPSLNPTFFQRTLIAKDTIQAKHAFAIASIICLLIYCLSSFIGLMTLAYKPGLDSNEVLTFAIDHFSYPIMKSFILIGIVAMVMSTADSWLNSGSVIFAHDICKPLGINVGELILSRLFTVFIGIGTIILTLYSDSLLEIVLIGANFYMPIVTVPLMLGLFRFRTTGKVVLITMALSMTVVIIWRYKVQPVTGIDSVIPGLITSLISIFLVHHILGEPGGWEENKNSNSKKKVVEPSIKAKIIESKQLFDKIKNKIGNFNLFEFADNYKPKSDIIYTYFAFAVLLTIITTLSIKRAVYKEYPYLITFLQAAIFCIATSFLCNKLWPKKFKDKYIGIIWYISLFVGLTVISSLLVLLSKFSHVSLTILTIHLTTISLLIGWRMSLIMIPVGLWLAFSLYKTSIGIMVPGDINDLKLKLMYILFTVAGFALTFLKDQQYQQEETEKKQYL